MYNLSTAVEEKPFALLPVKTEGEERPLALISEKEEKPLALAPVQAVQPTGMLSIPTFLSTIYIMYPQ